MTQDWQQDTDHGPCWWPSRYRNQAQAPFQLLRAHCAASFLTERLCRDTSAQDAVAEAVALRSSSLVAGSRQQEATGATLGVKGMRGNKLIKLYIPKKRLRAVCIL